MATMFPPNATTLEVPTPTATSPIPPLQGTARSNSISTGALMGIIMGSAVFVALLVGTAIFLHGRKEERAVSEMPAQPARRSVIKDRFRSRIFSPQQVEETEETSDRTFQCIGNAGRASISPRVWMRKEQERMKVAPEFDVIVANPLYSPSIYTPATTRFSAMTCVNDNEWLDGAIARRSQSPFVETSRRLQPPFVETSSQLLDVPSPLFSRAHKHNRMGGGTRMIAGPVRPTRSATPLGNIGGMGHGMDAGVQQESTDRSYH